MLHVLFYSLSLVPMTDDSLKMPKMDMKDMNVGNAFQQFLGILKLDKKVIEAVAKNQGGGPAAALFLLVGVALGPISQAIFGIRVFNAVIRPDISSVLVSIVGGLVAALLGFLVTTLVANRLFKGKGSFAEYFRVAGLAYGLSVLTVLSTFLPGLAALVGIVVALWGLVVGYVVIKNVFHLDDTNTVLTIIVTVVAIILIGAIVGSLGLAGGYGAGMSEMGSFDFSVTYE